MTSGATFSSSAPLLVITTKKPECFRCGTHADGILKTLQSRQDLCDIILSAGNSDKQIFAHSLILIAASDYFSALLSQPMGTIPKREITIDEVDENALEKVINYCYTGCLDLQGDEVEALLTTAHHLCLVDAVKGCVEFLQRHIQPSNCLSIALLAKRLNIEDLLHNAKDIFYKNFVEVSKHAEFLLLNVKQLSELMDRDELCIPNEEFLFSALINWIEHDPENRKKHFTELLVHVRCHLLHPSFMLEKVEPLCNIAESQELFLNVLKCTRVLNAKPSTNSIQSRIYQPKTVMKHLLVIYSSEGGNLVITGYNLHTKEWTKWKTLKERRSDFAVCVIANNLLIVGGNSYQTNNSYASCRSKHTSDPYKSSNLRPYDRNYLYESKYSNDSFENQYSNNFAANKVTSLSLYTMDSSTITPLGTSRTNHSVAILNGWVFAIGGKSSELNQETYLNSVERWNPMFQTWSDISPMKHARCDFAVAVIFEHLYVCGGISHQPLKSMECYDPVANIWKSRAPMNVARSSHCLAAYKGYLFAIGGCDASNNVTDIERYDPFTDTWTTISYSHGISGYTRCTSLGPAVFIYNNCKIFMVSSESNCTNLQLQMLPKSSDALMNISRPELFGTPYKISYSGSLVIN